MKNDSGNTTIEITTGTIIKVIVLLLSFWLVYYLRDLVLVILTSVVIASAMEPITVWFMKYRIPRVPAVIIIYVSSFLLIVALLGWFFPLVFDDFFKLVSTIPQYIRSVSFDEYMSSGPARILNNIKNSLASSLSLDDLIPLAGSAVGAAKDGVLETAKYFFGGLLSILQ